MTNAWQPPRSTIANLPPTARLAIIAIVASELPAGCGDPVMSVMTAFFEFDIDISTNNDVFVLHHTFPYFQPSRQETDKFAPNKASSVLLFLEEEQDEH